MNGKELYDFLRDERTPWDVPVRIVDMDGFVHDVAKITVDPNENVIWIRSKYTEEVKSDSEL